MLSWKWNDHQPTKAINPLKHELHVENKHSLQYKVLLFREVTSELVFIPRTIGNTLGEECRLLKVRAGVTYSYHCTAKD